MTVSLCSSFALSPSPSFLQLTATVKKNARSTSLGSKAGEQCTATLLWRFSKRLNFLGHPMPQWSLAVGFSRQARCRKNQPFLVLDQSLQEDPVSHLHPGSRRSDRKGTPKKMLLGVRGNRRKHGNAMSTHEDRRAPRCLVHAIFTCDHVLQCSRSDYSIDFKSRPDCPQTTPSGDEAKEGLPD